MESAPLEQVRVRLMLSKVCLVMLADFDTFCHALYDRKAKDCEGYVSLASLHVYIRIICKPVHGYKFHAYYIYNNYYHARI